MPTLTQDLAGQILAKRNSLQALFEKKTADGRLDWTAADRDKAKELDAACNDLAPQLEAARADEAMEQKNRESMDSLNQVMIPGSFEGSTRARNQRPYHGSVHGEGASLMERKAIGASFIEHKGYQERPSKNGTAGMVRCLFPEFEVKTLFQTTAGWDPFVPRLPLIALSPQQRPRVVDLLPAAETQFHSIKWMLETLYTNNAAPTAEAGAYPEAALQFTEQLSAIQKISVFLPVTDEQFEDAPMMRDILNNRLELMIRQKLDQQLLGGNGTAPNLSGLLNVTGINTRALGADPIPSALFKSMTAIKTVGFAEPSGILMNPLDWQSIKLMQTADGLYIWGHPSENGPQTIWGLPVVDTTYMPQGTSMVGDFAMHTQLVWRKGLEFLTSNSHLDFFSNGKLAIRADIRVGFFVDRALALATVTGIPLAN